MPGLDEEWERLLEQELALLASALGQESEQESVQESELRRSFQLSKSYLFRISLHSSCRKFRRPERH